MARDGWLSAAVIVDLLGIDQATLAEWQADGLLLNVDQSADDVRYPAVDVVCAVAYYRP
jgi:predicted site-specific integrase-resolvase